MDLAVLAGGDAGKLRQLEVSGAELVEQSDDAVRVAAADSYVVSAEGLPGGGERKIELVNADFTERDGVAGGATSGDGAECAACAESHADVDGVAERFEGKRFGFHALFS